MAHVRGIERFLIIVKTKYWIYQSQRILNNDNLPPKCGVGFGVPTLHFFNMKPPIQKHLEGLKPDE